MDRANAAPTTETLTPPDLDLRAVDELLCGQVAVLLDQVRSELVGSSGHAHDPRVQLLVAELVRHRLAWAFDDHHCGLVAEHVADGTSLFWLGRQLGLGSRALGMRWKDRLPGATAPRLWLREHTET